MAKTQPDILERSAGSLGSVMGRISGVIAGNRFPNADRAALKRMDPKNPPPLAFYRFAFRHLPEGWQANRQTWQVIVSGMALMHPHIHRPDLALGKALAQSSYSEARLERLLAAEGETRLTLALRAVRFLAAKNIAFSWADMAGLLLARNPEKQERARMRIASDYYRNLNDKE